MMPVRYFPALTSVTYCVLFFGAGIHFGVQSHPFIWTYVAATIIIGFIFGVPIRKIVKYGGFLFLGYLWPQIRSDYILIWINRWGMDGVLSSVHLLEERCFEILKNSQSVVGKGFSLLAAMLLG